MLIIWKKVYAKVIVIEETNQYVHCYVKLASHTKAFYATFVYGLNGLEERKLLWKGLANLRFPVKPWIILSDFNALLNYGDRVGGKSVTKAEIEDFNVWLSLGQVDTIKRVGCYYTWSSNQGGHDRIYSRIDHAFMNEDWLDLFPNWMATFSWEVVSDHCAILVSLIVMVEIGVKPFEFFNYWCEHKDFENVVLESWMGNVEFDHQRAKEKFQEANLKAQANPGIEKFIEEEKLAPDNFAEIRAEVSNAIKEFFNTGKIPTQFNETLIYLVPKVEIPVRAIDYRPIACFSTIYKCITKLISKRLAKVLPWLVHQNQGIFIKNRPIAHNILIFQDLIKNYGRKIVSSRCAIKTDLSKAYDTVDWGFVEDLLSIIKEVERLCRDFLWGIKGEICKINLASWDKVFLPKAYGGLGFKSGPNWNRSILGKFIWAIMDKHGILWVKWINNICMKGAEFWEYELKGDTYNELIQLDADMFYKAVWCNVSLPKHRFVLCEEEESLHHLFFSCFVSKAVMKEVFDWVGYPAWPIEFNSWLCWITGKISGVITLI
uniref:Reverse transcriptase domain-containing protein n=1 Tax=Cannabis sativa TaxID=3483 RepID=A0A803Q9D7_CANSA